MVTTEKFRSYIAEMEVWLSNVLESERIQRQRAALFLGNWFIWGWFIFPLFLRGVIHGTAFHEILKHIFLEDIFACS